MGEPWESDPQQPVRRYEFTMNNGNSSITYAYEREGGDMDEFMVELGQIEAFTAEKRSE